MNNSKNKKNWLPLYWFLGFSVAIGVKWYFSQSSVEKLMWLLTPTTLWVEQMTNLSFISFEEGYVCTDISPNIIINESCSGLNFWVISFLTNIILFYQYLKGYFSALLYFLLSIAAAWLLTLFANTGRIVISIKVLPLLSEEYIDYADSHLLVGVFFYLTNLILYYLAAQKSLDFLYQKNP